MTRERRVTTIEVHDLPAGMEAKLLEALEETDGTVVLAASRSTSVSPGTPLFVFTVASVTTVTSNFEEVSRG
jgi:hypothetical protein